MRTSLVLSLAFILTSGAASVFADTAVVTNTISASGDSGGGQTSVQVISTVNGETIKEEVTSGNAASVSVTQTVTNGEVKTIVATSSTGSATPTPLRQLFPERVSVKNDIITVSATSRAPVQFNKADLVHLISVIDVDGDGSPDPQGEEKDTIPARITIDAIKVRTEVDQAKKAALYKTVTDPIAVVGADDLALFSVSALLDDAAVEDVSFENGNTIVEYTESVKLFGVLPLTMRKVVSAGSDGRVTVQFPWWSTFAKKQDGAGDLETYLNAAITDRNTAFSGLGVLPRHALMYQTVTNAMKTKHDTAKNAIGNIR